MPSTQQISQRRKDALREVRRRERAADSSIERMERRIYRLLDRKTLIDEADALELYDRYYKEFFDLVKRLEQGLADFLTVTSA